MSAAATARLVKGGRTLVISSGRYALGRDFVPPDVELSPTIAEGTSANRAGGGVKVGERAMTRTWEFSVYLQNCASEREVTQAARDLRDFLAAAGDESEPLFLEYRASPDIAALPLWGQGVLRYEIIHGRFSLGDLYSATDNRGRNVPACPVTVTLKPYAVGQQQRLMSASGGVFMDLLGVADGNPRGVVVAGSMANALINPVFGASTSGSGWTAATCLLVQENLDPAYFLPFARASQQLTSRNTASGMYAQSATLTNGSTYILTAITKLPDSSSPTTSDVQIWYKNAAIGPSYFGWGNGWWEVSASSAGNGAACLIGVQVGVGRSVYLGAMQTSPSQREPLCWGDMPGHAWSSSDAVNDSSSSRANSMLRISTASGDVFNPGQGGLVLAWRSFQDNTFGRDQWLFSFGACQMRGYFSASDDKFYFHDNTASLISAAQTFNAGCAFHLGYTWGPAGLLLYLNGAVAASTATYTVPASGTYLYLGTNETAASHAYGPFMDARLYAVQPTTAEMAADYASASPLITDGQPTSQIPFLWTKNGDDQLANVYDNQYVNWGVAGGVPGSNDAYTKIDFTSNATGGSPGAYWMSDYRIPYSRFVDPLQQVIGLSGQVDSDGDASGSLYASNPSGFTYSGTQIIPQAPCLISGEFAFFIRVKGTAGCTLVWQPSFKLNTTWIRFTSTSLTLTASYAYHYVSSGTAPDHWLVKEKNALLYVGYNASVLSGSFGFDQLRILPHPLFKLTPETVMPRYLIDGQYAAGLTKTGVYKSPMYRVGDTLELRPGMYNLLFTIAGSSGQASNKATTATFTGIWITPRYSLL